MAKDKEMTIKSIREGNERACGKNNKNAPPKPQVVPPTQGSNKKK